MKRLSPIRKCASAAHEFGAAERSLFGSLSRRGFTLMETLVALGLCGLIVASVGTSLELYWRFSSLSRERVTASQVQRGVVEDLTSDLRTAVPLDLQTLSSPEPADSPAALQGMMPGSAGAGVSMFLNVSEQMLSLTSDDRQPVQFFGSPNALAILTEHNNSRFAAHSSGSYRSVRQQHVVWWLNQGASVRLPLSAVGPRADFTTLTASNVAHGLVRVERPFSQAPNSERKVRPQLISEDITAIRFRYFDGQQWLDEWDSLRQLAIPEAVEVQLTFQNSTSAPQRIVMHLPQANRRR
jgi:type II secretory pathway pseudopilin PulG